MVSRSFLCESHLGLFLVSALVKVLCLVSLNQTQMSMQWLLLTIDRSTGLEYEDNGASVQWLPLIQYRETSFVTQFGFMNLVFLYFGHLVAVLRR